MMCYFLSENEASDISVATQHVECPEALFVLLRAMFHISDRARLMFSHSLAGTNREPSELKAYSLLARAAARVAREFWQTKGC